MLVKFARKLHPNRFHPRLPILRGQQQLRAANLVQLRAKQGGRDQMNVPRRVHMSPSPPEYSELGRFRVGGCHDQDSAGREPFSRPRKQRPGITQMLDHVPHGDHVGGDTSSSAALSSALCIARIELGRQKCAASRSISIASTVKPARLARRQNAPHEGRFPGDARLA
jgi:hypothetical protein